MKANKLMLGDIVRYKYEGELFYAKVLEVWQGCVTAVEIHGEYEPIELPPDYIESVPLATEILEKNGFKECQYWHEYKSGNIIIQVALPNMRMKNGNKEFSTDDIRSVHQLQHALRLCGIEKEIEL